MSIDVASVFVTVAVLTLLVLCVVRWESRVRGRVEYNEEALRFAAKRGMTHTDRDFVVFQRSQEIVATGILIAVMLGCVFAASCWAIIHRLPHLGWPAVYLGLVLAFLAALFMIRLKRWCLLVTEDGIRIWHGLVDERFLRWADIRRATYGYPWSTRTYTLLLGGDQVSVKVPRNYIGFRELCDRLSTERPDLIEPSS